MVQLELAVQRTAEPLRIFDSSGGFRLPDGSVLSPDASLVREERWHAPTPEQRRGFPPLCPDLVVELAGPSEEGPRGVSALRRKMDTYQANGALLGWLLLPEERAVELWRSGQPGMAQRLENATRLGGVSSPKGWRSSWRRSGRCDPREGFLRLLCHGQTDAMSNGDLRWRQRLESLQRALAQLEAALAAHGAEPGNEK
ncbi:MAG: Uma2 family endonuclease [Synechococcaceae cyanobacterium]|nr:Uma2 family endonuclease [Synechococcaceae cyanobacterium]